MRRLELAVLASTILALAPFRLVAAEESPIPSPDSSSFVIVHARLLHVRDLPSDQADVTAQLAAGQRATRFEERAGWSRLAYEHGDSRIEGWVLSKWVSPVSRSPEDPVARYAVVTAERVNLRSGPSTKEAAVHVLAHHDRVLVLKVEGRWYKVAFGEARPPVVGWVHANYVNVGEGEASPPGDKAGPSAGG